MKNYKLIPYRTFSKFEYYEQSEIDGITERIREDGGTPVIIEDETSIQIDGRFRI